jgi:hypothetical protein
MNQSALCILLLCSSTALLAACSSNNDASSSSGAPADAGVGVDGDAATAPPDVELLAVADLPRVDVTQGLSGTFFDATTGTLYAIQDTGPSLVPLSPSADYRSWTPGSPIVLSGRPNPAWDGEGLAREGDTFIAVTDETVPLVERFDASGKYLDAVSTPARFAKQSPGNKGLESLSLSPSAKYLFTANEGALTTDGTLSTKSQGTLVRVLRRDLDTGADEEHAYRTEPLGPGTGGDMGVSDVTAIADGTVLVLERGYQTGYGNTVRIFRADLASSPDVSSIDALDASTPVLEKSLVVDIGALPSDGVTHPGTQPNPILDNYEALALGPTLPDGRRVVFVTSDDNASAEQVARILALAIRL